MKIFAPNKDYSGVSAGTTFVKGVGETDDPRLIDWFKDHGYVVEDVDGDEPSGAAEMTKNDIMAELTVLEVEYNASAKKADLLDLLKKSRPTE